MNVIMRYLSFVILTGLFLSGCQKPNPISTDQSLVLKTVLHGTWELTAFSTNGVNEDISSYIFQITFHRSGTYSSVASFDSGGFITTSEEAGTWALNLNPLTLSILPENQGNITSETIVKLQSQLFQLESVMNGDTIIQTFEKVE
jgi:hypothetical protein